MSKPHEIERLVRKFKTFLKYRQEEKASYINGKLPPKQLTQMRKILEQAKMMEL